MRLSRLGIAFMALAMATALAMMLGPGLRAQQTKGGPAPAPIPTKILTATSVFISNAGVDGTSMAIFRRSGDTNQAYDQFYAAMKTWGRYQLTPSPADADLIFEVRFTAPLIDCGKSASYAPQLDLKIIDAKSHFILWDIAEPVEGALRIATWDRNLGEGVTNVVGDLQRLVAKPVGAGAQ